MAAAAPATPVQASKRAGERQEALAGYAFVAIPMVLFLVLNLGTTFYAFFISLWDWNIRKGPEEFLGLQNFVDILSDTTFQVAIKNSLYYTVIWVPLTMAIGLFLAVIVNQKIRGRTFFRAAFYFPAIASSAAITVLWIFLLQPDGLFNEVRGALGLNPLFQAMGFGPNQNWFGDYHTAMNSVIVLNAWTTSGTFMLFYLASLQSISNDVYEAAAIDGAGPWDAFWKVTFPLLKPGHFFVATVGVIGGLQLFDQALIAGGTNGDPNNSLMTVVLYLYNAAFVQLNFGYAAAVGVVLFLVIFTATLIQRRLFGNTQAA
ncbi:MAG TPA: sugar ABC transporter permease [Candidatus Limnocylindria bacterium]|nr:sugar ABC transporter permease [Candidatus Limnocylindria bacterium]